MKKDFRSNLNNQTNSHENSILKSKVSRLEDDIKSLRDKNKELLNVINQEDNEKTISNIPLSRIKLTTNIRDEYEYEQIIELTEDIKENGQLQSVLLTADNYLVAGYRRYYAMKNISNDYEVIVNKLDKKLSEISNEELKKIQYIENDQRRDIDNFQLAELFSWYIENGLRQVDIAEKFHRTKSLISKVLSIRNINSELKRFLKEFQVYGYSKKKLNGFNHENITPEILKDIENAKGIIGIKPLSSLGSCKEDYKKQKEIFLRKFGNRLHPDEINSYIFKDIDIKKPEKSFSEKFIMKIEDIEKLLQNQNTDFIESEEGQELERDLKRIKKKLLKMLS